MVSYRSNNYLGPPGFNQPNVQNNQNRYNQNQGYNQNRGNNFNQGNYQAPNNQAQVGPSNELSNYMKINETNMRATQNQITTFRTEIKNDFETKMAKQHNELKNMMSSFLQMQSPLGSGSLPSNTVANPRGDLKAITTQIGVAYDGPTIPLTPSPLQSFADALLYMPKFASTFKSFLSNKEKLFELASTALNENCSAMLLKKFPEKLRDPGKFLIPCDFSKLEECLALTDLGTSINLMPLSVWKKLSLPKLTPTGMTFGLANRSVAYPESVNRIDVIEVSCEEYAQELLGFSNSSTSGNPTPSDPIIASSSPSFTPFEGSDFILEEIETFLRTLDELTNLDDDYYDTKGDILYLEKLLNEDPSSNLSWMKNENLKQVDATMTKSSIEEPPELELKDLPSHLEYAFLERTDKLPIIISKELKDEEKAALLKDDFKPAVQHQKRVNLKIHEVIKKEVIELFDAGLIYHISDSPWETMEVFMDDFSVFGDSFSSCLSHLDKMLKRCEDTNLVLNWEKCHFMVKKGIVLIHKIFKFGIEVDRAKVDVIAKLPHPTSVKGVRSFLGHPGFYR
nr:hypothetical protein [Tanacetum cinerariifolium]